MQNHEVLQLPKLCHCLLPPFAPFNLSTCTTLHFYGQEPARAIPNKPVVCVQQQVFMGLPSTHQTIPKETTECSPQQTSLESDSTA